MYTKNLFKEMFFSLKFIVSFPIASGAIAREERLHPAKGMIPTPFRNYRPSAKGYHLIDTFSTNTGRKLGKKLIPQTSGFCQISTKGEQNYDTKRMFIFHILLIPCAIIKITQSIT